MSGTIDLIKEIFHPEPYPKIEGNIEDSMLHLSRESIQECKYILLVNNFDINKNLKQLVKNQKKQVKKYYKASLMTGTGIGIIQIFLGKYSDWKNRVNEAKPDWRGVQSVILQGILFIDPDEKKYKLCQSHWGPIKFGNFQGQMDKIHYLLGRIGAI